MLRSPHPAMSSAQALPALGSLLALVLTGCGDPEEPLTPGPAPEDSVVVAVGVDAPGLSSGTEPSNVTGSEADLASRLVTEKQVVDDESELSWARLAHATSQQATSMLTTGEADLVIARQRVPDTSDGVQWAGPYATISPALITASQPVPNDNATPTATSSSKESEQLIGPVTISDLSDLNDASVCIVAGSSADIDDHPGREITVQNTYGECATGLESGRYDAVAGDDLALAGLFSEDALPAEAYFYSWDELLEASQSAGNEDPVDALPDELTESSFYWVGFAPETTGCIATTQAISQDLTDGELESLLDHSGFPGGYTLQLPQATDITTEYCSETPDEDEQK
ncbi:hypothetical protein DYI20_01595 [Auritidibacter ignavus]|nr:hypothetical protein DYI20_01595 [Auritidibacter ignavus]